MFPPQDHAGPEELCEVAGYLGRADPWYESNINTLCHVIPKLATMVRGKPSHFPNNLQHPSRGLCPAGLSVPQQKFPPANPPQGPARRCRGCHFRSPQEPFAVMGFFDQGTGNGRFQDRKHLLKSPQLSFPGSLSQQ